MNVLNISNLKVRMESGVEVLHGVNLQLEAGRIQGLLGESGSGKTVTGLAVLGLLPGSAYVSGNIQLHGTELLGLTSKELNRIRGKHIGMVFQDPSTCLHPMLSIGIQLTDHMRRHLSLSKAESLQRANDLLRRVHVEDPENALSRYPHQFSGGQRQRIAIAVALACRPKILIADEPTTALDVTVQAGVLHLLRGLADEMGLAVLFVTHDLGVMSAIADDVAVMRTGAVVESGGRTQVFTTPQHPYTRSLLAAMPGSVNVLEDAGAMPPASSACPPNKSGEH